MAHCKITVRPIRPIEKWTSKQFTDWMHPIHGPLPDGVVNASSGTDHYVIALWADDATCIRTVLECPLKPVGRGAILWSARWAKTEDGDYVNPKTGKLSARRLDQYRDVEEFYQEFIPVVIEEAEASPLGDAVQGRRQVIKNGAWLKNPA
jgi:hypothetical protein